MILLIKCITEECSLQGYLYCCTVNKDSYFWHWCKNFVLCFICVSHSISIESIFIPLLSITLVSAGPFPPVLCIRIFPGFLTCYSAMSHLHATPRLALPRALPAFILFTWLSLSIFTSGTHRQSHSSASFLLHAFSHIAVFFSFSYRSNARYALRGISTFLVHSLTPEFLKFLL